MIRRRSLLAGVALAPFGAAVAALPVPPGDMLAFHILRKGKTIGEHTVGFSRTADTLTVSVGADIVVYLGPIAVFRYKHRATEVWQAGQVVSVDAETNDDGTLKRMTARRDTTGLSVEGTTVQRYIAPARSLPGTHWNSAMLDAPFINTEDGKLLRPAVRMAGIEQLDVTGGTVSARHYVLSGDADLDTFYDDTPGWAGLRFTAHDGSEIRYLRA